MLLNELYQGGIRAIIDADNTVFDNMVVPTGVTLADVVDRILFKYGDTPLFCPEPNVMKFYIAKWSNRKLPLWNRYKDAITATYNPIENYDRKEDSKRHFTHGHVVTTDDDLINGLTTENQVSADNATTYQPNTKAINSGTDYRDISEKHTGTDLEKFENRVHGNIGVTTTQQMLNQEFDIIPRLDLIDYSADDFKIEFCLYVY